MVKNFLKLLLFIVLIELIFGEYYKNFYKFKLNDERNVLRVYDLKIEEFENISIYYRDNNAFRTTKNFKINLEEIEVIYLGSSTANQRYLNYQDTIVNFLNVQSKKEKFLHAAVDGISIIGFINSFDMWFKEIKNLNPKQIIVFFDSNDYELILDVDSNSNNCNLKNNHRDYFQESNFRENLHWFLEANSTWVYFARRLKEYVFFKYNFDIGAKKVGKNLNKNFDGANSESLADLKILKDSDLNEILLSESFYDKFSKNYKNLKSYNSINKFVLCYQKKLKEFINLSEEKKITPIFMSPINGGKNDFKVILMNRIIKKFALENDIKFINIFENLNFEENDFFSYSGLTKNGSRKVSEYILTSLD